MRIAKRDALRFLASCMTFEEGHSLDVCMVPGAIQLTAAKEVQTRNAAFRSLLYIAQHTEEPSYLVHDTGLLEAMEDGLNQYNIERYGTTTFIGISEHPEAQAELKRCGFA